MELNITNIILITGIFCVAVNVITELLKGVVDDCMNNISKGIKFPTNLQVIITSELIVLLTFLGYTSYIKYSVSWYMVVAVIFYALLIAFISMNGWNSLSEICNRFIKKSGDNNGHNKSL